MADRRAPAPTAPEGSAPPTGLGYDRWAALYPRLERLAFGSALARARRTHLPALAAALPRRSRVLMLGEGNGDALAALLALRPDARCTVVDASRAMLARAAAAAPRRTEVRTVHADLRRWHPEARAPAFDLIVGCFVLDLFHDATLARLVPRWAATLHPAGAWLHVDFARPAAGWRRAGAELGLRLLYRAFGAATRMETRTLPDCAAALRNAGLRCETRAARLGGWLESSVWRPRTEPSEVPDTDPQK